MSEQTSVDTADRILTGTPTTLAEAVLEIRYQIRLHFVHRRLYLRLRAGSTIVSLLAGSAAVATAMQNIPHLVLVSGVVVAAMSALDTVAGWSDRAARHEMAHAAMVELLAGDPDLATAKRELVRHELICLDEIEALRVPTFNEVMRANGHESWQRPVNSWGRIVSFVA